MKVICIDRSNLHPKGQLKLKFKVQIIFPKHPFCQAVRSFLGIVIYRKHPTTGKFPVLSTNDRGFSRKALDRRRDAPLRSLGDERANARSALSLVAFQNSMQEESEGSNFCGKGNGREDRRQQN
jgi:hypothetical protein